MSRPRFVMLSLNEHGLSDRGGNPLKIRGLWFIHIHI